jgi:hypothetical protein
MCKVPVFANQVTLSSLSCSGATYRLAHGLRVGSTQDKDDVDFLFVECPAGGCRVFGHLFESRGVVDRILVYDGTNVPCTLAVGSRGRKFEDGSRWEWRSWLMEGKVDDAVVKFMALDWRANQPLRLTNVDAGHNHVIFNSGFKKDKCKSTIPHQGKPRS